MRFASSHRCALSVMVGSTIAFRARSSLLCIGGLVTSQRFIDNVLDPVLIILVQALPGPYIRIITPPACARDILAFLAKHNYPLLRWLTRSLADWTRLLYDKVSNVATSHLQLWGIVSNNNTGDTNNFPHNRTYECRIEYVEGHVMCLILCQCE